ncbi:MAG: hypothetical protein JWN23_1362 [Rhodocyclales bacterium]|nr:hypothetical protein [Rhodocyclales bacterium]
MIKRLLAIGFIFLCTSAAWAILSGVITARTTQADTNLRQKIENIWGAPQIQNAPTVVAYERRQPKNESADSSKTPPLEAVSLSASDVRVNLELHHRQKGLLWYSTYSVGFDASYEIVNAASAAREFEVNLPFPSRQAAFDDLRFEVSGKSWSKAPNLGAEQISGRVVLEAGERAKVKVGYRSQGLDSWTYQFGNGVSQVENFRLVMDTNFRAIDFPDAAMSPLKKERTDTGWQLTWESRRLVSGVNITMVMPEKLQPGPLAGDIARFAPLSMFFFIVVLLTIGVVKGIDLHPMHFFFLAAAFFAFHLLFSYLVDLIAIHIAFAVSAVTSLALVISYLRIVFGSRFAFLAAGSAQLVYLVLFSYAFFFKGLTGIAITVGAVATLFVLMQATARIDWSKVFLPQAAR